MSAFLLPHQACSVLPLRSADEVCGEAWAQLHFEHKLTKIDGEGKIVTFTRADGEEVQSDFDMIHVCWLAPVCPGLYPSITAGTRPAGLMWTPPPCRAAGTRTWALGDVMNAPNAKPQRLPGPRRRWSLPICCSMRVSIQAWATTTASGSRPLTVERGKIVLAEFGYGGKIVAQFPQVAD